MELEKLLIKYAKHLAKEDKEEQRFPIDNQNEFNEEFISVYADCLETAFESYKKALGKYKGGTL